VFGRISTWGRCYDHNFLLFFPIFGGKNGVFPKADVMINFFAKTSSRLSKKRQILRRKYFKNHNIGPWSLCQQSSFFAVALFSVIEVEVDGATSAPKFGLTQQSFT
jgi:hypothetical protein